MKMKNESSGQSKRLLKTAKKNEEHFLRIASNDRDFLSTLTRLSFIVFEPNQPPIDELLDFDDATLEKRLSNRDRFASSSRKIYGWLSSEKQKAVSEGIDSIMERYNLGNEWRETFFIFSMTGGILIPPTLNLHIGDERNETHFFEERQDDGQTYSRLNTPKYGHLGRIVLVLNPDTSLDDIKDAWLIIKEAQRALWRGRKRFKVTKNSKKELWEELKLKVQHGKGSVSEDEKYSELTDYERILLKKYGESEGRKKIFENRRGKRDEAKLKGPIDKRIFIKKKRTDLEIAKQSGLSGAAADKQVDRSRHSRKRNKMTHF